MGRRDWGHHEEQVVADLAGGAGDGNADGVLPGGGEPGVLLRPHMQYFKLDLVYTNRADEQAGPSRRGSRKAPFRPATKG